MSSFFARSLDYSKIMGQVALSKVAPTESFKKATEKALAQKLLELRGAPTKISQILSMKGEESQQALRRKSLQEIPPIPLDEIKTYLEDYAPSLNSQIHSISQEAKAASLGQVHKINLKDSERNFALKIQYPDAKEIMALDQGLFKLVTKTFDTFKEGFSLDQYQRSIRTELLEELDYQQELKTQQDFFEFFQEQKQIIIPRTYPEKSSSCHIFMDFEEALCIDDFLAIANEQQIKEARELISTFYLESLFLLGTIHSDPNPGNINFRINDFNETELVVYDFGSTKKIPVKERLAILCLIENSELHKPSLLPYFAELGFDCDALASLGDKLHAFSQVIFEPFNSITAYDLKKWNRSERSKGILSDQRFIFMTAAPPSLLASMRLFQGLFFYLERLDNTAFFQLKLKEIKNKYSSEIRNYTPPKIQIPENYNSAKQLSISVHENGKQKVSIKLPRKAVENLNDFIDGDIKKKIIEQNISIEDILKTIRQSAYCPQEILNLKVENKIILISLE